MEQQAADQKIQLLLKQFQIYHPRRNCLAGKEITNICINPLCDSDALYCGHQSCSCSRPHIICEHIYLRSFTHLLQKRSERQKQFILKVLQIENSMIQEIQKRRKELVQKFYQQDMQVKYLKVFEALYTKKQEGFKLSSSLGLQTYEVLKRGMNQRGQSDRQLIQDFKVEVQAVLNKLKEAETKLIEDCTRKSKVRVNDLILDGSKIITNQDKHHLKFLNQSFLGAKHFKLLFRASEHDFLATQFHEHCDNITNTFTIIKTEYGKIIGGYTPLKWKGTQKTVYVADNQGLSFLLSFNQRQKFKIDENEKSAAILNSLSNGPTFGRGHDIFISNRCNKHENCYASFPRSFSSNGKYSRSQETYKAFVGATNGNKFKVVEYEVYKVFWE